MSTIRSTPSTRSAPDRCFGLSLSRARRKPPSGRRAHTALRRDASFRHCGSSEVIRDPRRRHSVACNDGRSERTPEGTVWTGVPSDVANEANPCPDQPAGLGAEGGDLMPITSFDLDNTTLRQRPRIPQRGNRLVRRIRSISRLSADSARSTDALQRGGLRKRAKDRFSLQQPVPLVRVTRRRRHRRSCTVRRDGMVDWLRDQRRNGRTELRRQIGRALPIS